MEIHSTLLGRQVLLEKGIYYHIEERVIYEIKKIIGIGYEFCDPDCIDEYLDYAKIIVLEDHLNKKLYPITDPTCYDYLSAVVDYHNEVINYGKDEDLTEKTSKSKNNVYLIDL